MRRSLLLKYMERKSRHKERHGRVPQTERHGMTKQDPVTERLGKVPVTAKKRSDRKVKKSKKKATYQKEWPCEHEYDFENEEFSLHYFGSDDEPF
jgi:hypothetical protein